MFSIKKLKNKKNLNRLIALLLQVAVVIFLLVIIFEKEAILIIKDIIEKLQFNEELEALIYKLLLISRMVFSSPSAFAFLFILMQIVCTTYSKDYWKILVPMHIVEEKENIETNQYPKIDNFNQSKDSVYLENLHLLF